ncbi:MAG TPA: TIGR03620 family F420-dependent LLM class oxidoreductase [Candidatus Binataceae bacterium]|nr:TIGR03620 family F420-dependent LLM class oxidoreductase [Candidatus Binataceae bacterium]
MDLTTPGILGYFDTMSGSEGVGFAHAVEKLGYSTLWIPETFGRDPFVMAAHVLNATSRITVGTAIANVWKREPMAAGAAARTLTELFPDRFILGLGVSAGPFMLRNGLKYDKPVRFMREYLEGIKSAPYKAIKPAAEPPVVIAGLLPRMMQVGAEYSDGIITALMPPSHIAKMRAQIGPSKWLLAQQMVMLEDDAGKARAAVREFMRFYLNAPPYQRNFKMMGFDESEMRGGGSDRLIDAIIAWGDERCLRERIDEHYRAGANHVYLIPLSADGGRLPEMRVVEALAPRR